MGVQLESRPRPIAVAASAGPTSAWHLGVTRQATRQHYRRQHYRRRHRDDDAGPTRATPPDTAACFKHQPSFSTAHAASARRRVSGGLRTFTPLARPCRRHDLPGQCPCARDHDQLTSGGADSEGSRVGSYENAQDVGGFFAGTWVGSAPADHNSLAHVGGREPNFKPVAQHRSPAGNPGDSGRQEGMNTGAHPPGCRFGRWSHRGNSLHGTAGGSAFDRTPSRSLRAHDAVTGRWRNWRHRCRRAAGQSWRRRRVSRACRRT
jgi:hypothetical protein